MCIAIVKPQNTTITEKRLRTCFENNPDGAGFAYRTENGLVVVKGMFKIEDFLKAYREHNVEATDALIHFRITTRGDDSADNCHPFALGCGALVHNGTISDLGEVGKGKSDTRLLAEELYSESFETLQRLKPTIERSIQNTRVAIMSHDGQFMVLNADQWTLEEGVYYSNDSYEPWEMPLYSGRRFMGSTTSINYPRLVDWSTFDAVTEEDDEAPVDAGADLLDLDTMTETYYEGFFWCNGELWVEDYTRGFHRDTELEDEVLDDWHAQYGTFPTVSQKEEFLDFTRWYVEQDYPAVTSPQLKKAS